MVTRYRVAALTIIGLVTLLTGGCTMDDNPHDAKTAAADGETVALIDGMRTKGSFEAARQRLNATAQTIGERIAAAVPGQTWRFTADPNLVEMNGQGQSCDELPGDIARRPKADTVEFGRRFSAQEFGVAAQIVEQEAAHYGATGESSLFNEEAKRDYDIAGNGYEFRLGQVNFARLHITGECFLLQRVLDLPAGQLPPQPPIVPTP